MAEKEYQELNDKLEELKRLIIMSGKEVLTLEECAVYTGYSKNHIYKLTSQRAIPFYKPCGGHIHFKKSEVDEWMLQGRQATNREINNKATTYCVTHK